MTQHTIRNARLALGGVALILAGLPAPRAQGTTTTQTVSQVAAAMPLLPGAPRRSDVSFSSRSKRVASEKDPHDTFVSARAFHATRLDWVYEKGDKEFVSKAKSLGYTFNGALVSLLDDSPDTNTQLRGRALNLDGDFIDTLWKRHWNWHWQCANHPDAREIWMKFAQRSIDAGVDSIHMDGAQLEIVTRYGGCFCPVCMAGFRDYLARHTTPEERQTLGVSSLAAFDYGSFLKAAGTKANQGARQWNGPRRLRDLFVDFQKESSLRFYQDVYPRLDLYAGRKVPHSCNATDEFLDYLHLVHDFTVAEAYPHREGQPEFLYSGRMAPVRKLGKSFLFTFVSRDVSLTRRFVGLVYALGGNVVVPWDVYIAPTAPRFFATPEQFADLYGFVRANAAYLDGYEEAAIAGGFWREERYGDTPPLRINADHDIYGVVRAKPGEADAPVVIHLVDWSETPAPFTIALDSARLFGDRPLKFRLLVPAPYDAARHEAAEASKDFSGLVRTLDLPGGRVGTIEIPALSPWGTLIVEPAEGGAAGVWQPMIWAETGPYYQPEARVRMRCATEGAEVRFTTDGSEPTASSPLFTAPLELTQPGTFQARAFNGGQASAIAKATLAPVLRPESLIRNGDFSGGTDNWHVVQAAEAKDGLEVSAGPSPRSSSHNALKARILKEANRPYHLRLHQTFPARSGQLYTLRFTAWADQPTKIEVGMMNSHAPHHMLYLDGIELTAAPTTYSLAGRSPADLPECGLYFDLGASEAGRTIWIEHVTVTEQKQ